MNPRLLALSLTFSLAALVAPHDAAAFSSGVSSNSFGATGCNQCHSGGTAPAVSITGPSTVTAGTTNEYLLTITSPAGQLSGGLNASVDIGSLAVGGAESGMTKTIAGSGGNDDVTHSTTKAGNGSEVLFSFLFDAPASPGTATIDVWGNAVNGTGNQLGDRATMDSLTVTVEAAPLAPVPAASPWSQAGMVVLLLAAGSLFVLRRRSEF